MVRGLLNKKGISILELVIVIFIIGVIISTMITNALSRINQAKYEKTVNELTSIAQASVDYFNLEGNWPDTIIWEKQLAPQFMPHVNAFSPFGTTYNINGVNNMVTASVLIPTGIAQSNPQQGQLWVKIPQGGQDKIEITQTIQNEFTSRLSYCKNYVC